MKYTLPKSKYVLELKDFISNRVFREYQKIITTDVEVSGSNADLKLKMGKIYEAQDYVLENSIVGLVNVEGIVMEKPFDIIMELGVEDGNFVYEKIADLINGSTMDDKVKKNGLKAA